MNLTKLISTTINRRQQSLEEVLPTTTTKVPCTRSTTRCTKSDSKADQGSCSSSQALDTPSNASWRIVVEPFWKALHHTSPHLTKLTSPNSAENILTTLPPSHLEWWDESERLARNDDNEPSLLSSHQDLDTSCGSIESNTSGSRTFHNQGLLLWEMGRAEWRKQRVNELTRLPQPIRFDEADSEDITAPSLQHTLPGRIRLSDLVTVFNYTWEYDSDSL